MKPRRIGPPLFSILALLPVNSLRASDELAPMRISRGGVQLFVDDALIESQSDLKRTLHQPVKETGGNTPLIWAAYSGSLDVMRLLLERGADTQVTYKKARPLRAAQRPGLP